MQRAAQFRSDPRPTRGSETLDVADVADDSPSTPRRRRGRRGTLVDTAGALRAHCARHVAFLVIAGVVWEAFKWLFGRPVALRGRPRHGHRRLPRAALPPPPGQRPPAAAPLGHRRRASRARPAQLGHDAPRHSSSARRCSHLRQSRHRLRARRAHRHRPRLALRPLRGCSERAFMPVRRRQPDDPHRGARAAHRRRPSGRGSRCRRHHRHVPDVLPGDDRRRCAGCARPTHARSSSCAHTRPRAGTSIASSACLPRCPYLFTALKVAAAASIVGAIIGEGPGGVKRGSAGPSSASTSSTSPGPRSSGPRSSSPRSSASRSSSSSGRPRCSSCATDGERPGVMSDVIGSPASQPVVRLAGREQGRSRSGTAADRRPQGIDLDIDAGRVRVAHRALRLRQVDAPAHRRRPHRADGRDRSRSTASPPTRPASTATTAWSSRRRSCSTGGRVEANVRLPLEVMRHRRRRA